MGFLHRLRNDIAGGHGDELTPVAGEGGFGHAAKCDLEPLLPHAALVGGINEEPAQLGLRGRLAGAEVDPAA